MSAKKVRMAHLAFGSSLKNWLIADAMGRVASSGRYIGGLEVEAFEDAWASYCGAKYCVGVSSGFAALQLALRSMAPPWEDDVHYSSLTCPPTPLAIMEADDTLCPVPICPSGGEYIIKPNQLQEGLNVPVWLYGMMDPEIEESEKVIILQDACQAHGHHYRDHKMASKCTAAAWSFYPTKNLGAMGDAGALTTNDEGLAQEVRELSNCGVDRAVNARLDPLQAAILLAKLRFLDSENAQREANAQVYLAQLRPLVEITRPVNRPGILTNWHQFPILVDDRQDLQSFLIDRGIETQVHYPKAPLFLTRKETPWERKWGGHVLSLPIGPHLGEPDIKEVCKAIKEWKETA